MMKTQYAYASEPRPALDGSQAQTQQANNPQQPKKLYRSDDPTQQQPQRPVNIMYDRRIYRGNTYALPVLPAYAAPDALDLQRQQQQRRKIRAARRADASRRPRTPDAVDGRAHMEVQTELYLEELGDTVPETCVAVQTDAFLDRAPSPLYIPAKSGVDATTQIMPGDLFDFDAEVEPLLEVLVGKTLDRARSEVLEEQELAALRRRQRDHAARRAAELAEVQRLEQAEKRRTEEKERRKTEAARLLQEKHDAASKVAAASFASVYLSSLVPSAFDALQAEGFFYDAREREVQQMFLPWITGQVEARVQRLATARLLVDALIEESVKRRTYQPEQPQQQEPVAAPVQEQQATDAPATQPQQPDVMVSAEPESKPDPTTETPAVQAEGNEPKAEVSQDDQAKPAIVVDDGTDDGANQATPDKVQETTAVDGEQETAQPETSADTKDDGEAKENAQSE